MKVKNTEDFIEKAKQINGDKYDYSKVEYKNTNTKVCIICPEHGEFQQTPKQHLTGQGCPFCGRIKAAKTRKHYVPERKWTYETCVAEAQRFSVKADFRETSLSAYQAAYKNGWLKDYTWLGDRERKHKWDYNSCYAEAQRYKTRSTFAKGSQGAYLVAMKNNWLDDYTWFESIQFTYSEGKVDCIYAYEFQEQHAVYVGRTLMKRKEQRDIEHLFHQKDSVYKFAVENGVEIPKPRYLAENLTLNEGVEQEKYWINKYRDEGWTLLNKNKGGSLGRLATGKWNRRTCWEAAKSCKTNAEFRKGYDAAYRLAKKNGWLEEYTWLEQQFLWTPETAIAESRKYQYWTDFIKQSPGAYAFVKTHSLKEQITWLGGKRKPNGYWGREECYRAAQSCKTMKEFRDTQPSAYDHANRNGWLKDYTWLEWCFPNQKQRNTWNTYFECYSVAQQFTTWQDFRKYGRKAYEGAKRNGWLDDYTWLTNKPRKATWTRERCYEEAQKYTRYRDFYLNSRACHAAAKQNGWIEDYTWLEHSDPHEKRVWTLEKCREVALRYDSLLSFRKENKTCYDSSLKYGYLEEFTWLRKTKPGKQKKEEPPDSHP